MKTGSDSGGTAKKKTALSKPKKKGYDSWASLAKNISDFNKQLSGGSNKKAAAKAIAGAERAANGQASGATTGGKAREAAIRSISQNAVDKSQAKKIYPLSASLSAGAKAGAKSGSTAGRANSPLSKSLSSGITAGAKAGSSGKKISTSNSAAGGAGGSGDGGFASIYDGLDPNTAATAQKMASSGASSKTLAQYIKDANKGLGKGTDYSALGKQLATDSKNASTNVGTLYKALQTGIRGNDATLKKIYDDSAKQTAAAGSQSQSTISAAYDQARAAVQERAAATGSTVSAADTANATSDEANAVQRSAQNQQDALTQNSAIEANSRRSNADTATAAGFQGAETQASIAQGLADNQAKLKVQQSTEDTQRRQAALQYALQMQNSDRDYSMQSQQLAQSAAQNSFSNQLALAGAKLQEANMIGDNQVAQQNADTRQAEVLQKAQADADAAATKANQQRATAADQAKAKRAGLYVQLLKQYNGDDAKAKQALKALGY